MSDFIAAKQPGPPRLEQSPQEMRRLINEHGYRGGTTAHSAHIVRRSLDLAAMMGLSGEETYVFVAFNLMKAFDRLFADQIDYINRTAAPSFIIPKPDQK